MKMFLMSLLRVIGVDHKALVAPSNAWSTTNFSIEWIMGNNASFHVTGDKSLLGSYHEVQNLQWEMTSGGIYLQVHGWWWFACF